MSSVNLPMQKVVTTKAKTYPFAAKHFGAGCGGALGPPGYTITRGRGYWSKGKWKNTQPSTGPRFEGFDYNRESGANMNKGFNPMISKKQHSKFVEGENKRFFKSAPKSRRSKLYDLLNHLK